MNRIKLFENFGEVDIETITSSDTFKSVDVTDLVLMNLEQVKTLISNTFESEIVFDTPVKTVIKSKWKVLEKEDEMTSRRLEDIIDDTFDVYFHIYPQDYMIGANMQPYQYNINPQLREADQSFAQGQEAVRNAGLGGGSYAANMQQLANSRNQAIGGLYAQKQNADAESYNQAMSQNKAIEAQNLERKMGILDFNLKSKAAKTAMLQSGLTQLAQISEGSQSKKLQLALMKALAPDFAGTMAYNSIADQYLNKMKEKKKAKATDKTKG